MRAPAFAVLLSLVATPALSDIRVTFTEGAPKDRFTIASTSDCDIGTTEIVLDLSGSAHGLIFDTTGAGQGVSVYQPFEIVSGAGLLTALPSVQDGDKVIRLSLAELPYGQTIAFTIDVDDTAGISETMVSGAEITGASVSVQTPGSAQTATFDASATASVPLNDCLS
ncbi:MAG: aggregation factor core [Pseudomonadota bacterium]